MRYLFLVILWGSLPMLQGCNPTFNWRDVRPDQIPLAALFPCKPAQDARVVSLGAKDLTMTLLGCDAGGATFTLAWADTNDAALTGTVLGQWKNATLASLKASSARELPFLLKGASVLPQSVQLEARGVRQDGTAISVQAVWFAVGSRVFQAAMYAAGEQLAVAETYFAGLKLQ